MKICAFGTFPRGSQPANPPGMRQSSASEPGRAHRSRRCRHRRTGVRTARYCGQVAGRWSSLMPPSQAVQTIGEVHRVRTGQEMRVIQPTSRMEPKTSPAANRSMGRSRTKEMAVDAGRAPTHSGNWNARYAKGRVTPRGPMVFCFSVRPSLPLLRNFMMSSAAPTEHAQGKGDGQPRGSGRYRRGTERTGRSPPGSKK